jgi:hypothetical protein
MMATRSRRLCREPRSYERACAISSSSTPTCIGVRLVITTDCGFGREGLSRRIAYYKCVSLVEGTNIVRRELGLPEARVRAADPRLYFAES